MVKVCHLAHIHLWLGTASSVGVAHKVTQTTRHIETWIAPVLCVDAMICVTIENDTAASLLNTCSLILEVWLVISGQCNSLKGATWFVLESAQHYRAVSNVRNCELVLIM